MDTTTDFPQTPNLGICMVPVEVLLKRVTYSVDCGPLMSVIEWADMFSSKMVDMSFWQLLDAIPVQGFTSPIAITPDYEAGDDLSFGWMVGNGHHRLCAAIFLGLDEVPVVFRSNPEDYYPAESIGLGEQVTVPVDEALMDYLPRHELTALILDGML